VVVPAGIGIVDTMIGLPSVDRREWYESTSAVLHDEGSKTFQHPAATKHANGLIGSIEVDPNRGVAAARQLERAVCDHGIRAAQFFPADLGRSRAGRRRPPRAPAG
jgi:hypothetical protein